LRLFPDSVPPVSPLLAVRLWNLKSAISNYRQVSRSMGSLPFASRRSTGVRPRPARRDGFRPWACRLFLQVHGREPVLLEAECVKKWV
jgi:hypothetical protein